ncbi:potassium transporter [Thioalkalivibrio versutus]|uniref:Trk system potassium uptake protein n=1 Tax=Thioalkalivibrio versutus TaxID=106634 RepID=A0A0G3G3J1_9GAMM|nr:MULTISPECIES: TrkH family potassium uptake protein [Thioalkalivibrio]AKJ94092.1 potassium transporter [Thioalkalivibrio versutus]
MLHLASTARLLGVLLTLFSLAMLPPAAIGFLYGESTAYVFLQAFALLLLMGGLLWAPLYRMRQELQARDGFILVVLFWLGLGIAGATPLYLDPSLQVSFTDAAFESMSGLTTTGATVLTGLDDLPRALLWYRQQLQWMGGMGIIVLAVAILPLLGVGGMQLFKAETPGPIRDNKLTPRIAETARNLWYIYLGLTVACALAYWAAGMDAFDAIAHSFTTVAIGGFSTYDASIGHFDSVAIEMVAIAFMVLGGMNFALHFLVLHRATWKPYRRDEELRAYLLVLGSAIVLVVGFMLWSGFTDQFGDALRRGVFHVVSIATTTGYATDSFYLWPGFLPVLLILLSFIGGCTGSTGGGMKVVRVLLLVKQGLREIKRLIHPHARIAVKVNGKEAPDRVVQAVWGFLAAYVMVFVVMMLGLMASGLDQVTAFSAVAASLNNLGPGLGEVGPNFQSINDFSKWVLVVAMLMGRLEIFTVLVLLSPAFWRR